MSVSENKNIYIIDDDRHTIQVLRHVLSKKGYHVKSSESGLRALEDFSTYTPDLILLDIIMPEMDGFQVIDLLKKDNNTAAIPVIFITAANDTTELVKGFDAGAVDFISKPVNKAELLARVNTHLELKNARDIIEQNNRALNLEIINRKQVEEKFRALSETAFEAVLFLQNNTIIELNRAAYQLFGFNADRRINRSIFSFTDEKGMQMLKRIFEARDTSGPWEISFFDYNQKSFDGLVQYQTIHYKGEDVNVLAVRDITRQKEIDNEIFNAIIDAEEKERKRFSRDMHDGLGALLSALKIYVNLFQKENKSESEKQLLLSEMKDTINKAVEAARTIANNLMPSVLMDHGLIKALKSFTDSINKTKVLHIKFSYSQQTIPLDPNTETHLYRIALELINNTLKYAEASLVELEVGFTEKHIVINYKDNGKGFDFEQVYNSTSGSKGLKNILSRVNFMNGEGVFKTFPGEGLSFMLKVPF